MTDEKREPAKWFLDLQKNESENIDSLEESEIYGKGIKSVFSYTPSFNGKSPEYLVNNIDKELELYTLVEATETLGINDLFKGILNSPLIPKSKTRLDSALFSNIKSGLVCYAQPKISEDGELLAHDINIETTLEDGSASDIFVIIAKTGAKLNFTHTFKGGTNKSMLGRKMLIICEDGAMVRFIENINNPNGALSLEYISLVGPQSNVTFEGTANTQIILRQKIETYLLGDGSNSSFENVYLASNDSEYDISNGAYLKSETAHATIHTGAIVKDKSHLIYRSGIISDNDNNGSVDEGKLLLVGEKAKIDTLPIKDSHSIRQVSESYLDEASNTDIEQFLNRIISSEHINKILK